VIKIDNKNILDDGKTCNNKIANINDTKLPTVPGAIGDDIVAGIIAGLCASATNVLIVNYL
jgi:hypothetical protein